jgi:hypothetical protein
MDHGTVAFWRVLFAVDRNLNSVFNTVEVAYQSSPHLAQRVDRAVIINPDYRVVLVLHYQR